MVTIPVKRPECKDFDLFQGVIESQTVWNPFKMSFRRKPESSDFSVFWTPDQVRHNEFGLFTISSRRGKMTTPLTPAFLTKIVTKSREAPWIRISGLTGILPAYRSSVPIRHVAMKRAGIVIKNKGQKKTISLPHR